MKKLSYIASALVLMLGLSSFTQVEDVAKEKKEKAKTEKVKKEGKAKKQKKVREPKPEKLGELTNIWAFGFAASFKDSTLYMTDLQEIRQVRVQPKTLFLENCDDYSGQLKSYLEDEKGLKDRTCCVFYETKKKDAEKKYLQIRNRYNQETHMNLRFLNTSEFQFKKPENE